MTRDLRIPGIVRGPVIHIFINGRKITAFKGETVLAALTAAGIKTLGIDPHGHGRGALCGMGVCYQCRVSIDGRPGCRACMTQVRAGMVIETEKDVP